MILIELFLTFVRIGFTSFGGISAIPLVLEEMERHQWMSASDLSNLIAIAEMTPGPLGLNCATFVGIQTAGFWGSLAAVAGVLTPAFTLTLVVAVFFHKFRESKIVVGIMRVIRPVCIAMILGVIVTLVQENYILEGQIDLVGIGIGLVGFYMIQRHKWSVPKVIGGAAVLGIVCFGVLWPSNII